MIDNYKSLFDLNVPLSEGSFNSTGFKMTMCSGKPILRTFELFKSEEINVLIFSYSFEIHENIFVRVNNPLEGYRADRYYPLSSSGESSCGDIRTFTLNNFWTKYDQKLHMGTRGDNMYVNKMSKHDNIFLKKEHDLKVSADELKFPYINFPEMVRSVNRAYITKDSKRIIVPHYSACGKYGKQVHGIDCEGNVEQYSIISDITYRDGGTTHTELADSRGIIHQYYTPTPFKPTLQGTFDNEVMYIIDEAKELLPIIERIGLVTFPIRSN